MDTGKLKRALFKATGCDLQHDGWPCGSCFFAMSDNLSNQDWQAVLSVRGDYSLAEMDNLPEDIGSSLERVLAIAKATAPATVEG